MLESVHELVLVETSLHLEALNLDIVQSLLQKLFLIVHQGNRLQPTNIDTLRGATYNDPSSYYTYSNHWFQKLGLVDRSLSLQSRNWAGQLIFQLFLLLLLANR